MNSRYILRYYQCKYSFVYGVIWPIKNAVYFSYLALLFLRGKLTLIDIEKCDSNGGYKYLVLVISRRPLSKSHTYDDLA